MICLHGAYLAHQSYPYHILETYWEPPEARWSYEHSVTAHCHIPYFSCVCILSKILQSQSSSGSSVISHAVEEFVAYYQGLTGIKKGEYFAERGNAPRANPRYSIDWFVPTFSGAECMVPYGNPNSNICILGSDGQRTPHNIPCGRARSGRCHKWEPGICQDTPGSGP